MGKLDYLRITNLKSAYRPGEIVEGQIEFNYSEKEKLRGIRIELTGLTSTRWEETTQHTDSEGHTHTETEYYSYCQMHVDNVTILWGSPSSASRQSVKEVATGHTVLPFTFELPQNLPESFQGSYGLTQYTLKAVMDRPWKFDHTFSKIISIVSPLDLNHAENHGYTGKPLAQEHQELGSKRMTCCCCFPMLCNGRIHYDIKVGKTGYVPGESIRVWGTVRNNTKGKLENLRLKLQQRITYYGTQNGHTFKVGTGHSFRGSNCKGESRVINETPLTVSPSVVNSNQTVRLGGAANDTTCIVEIPPMPCTRFDNTPIEIEYILTLTMDGDNCCESVEPKITDIVIGGVPIATAPIYPPRGVDFTDGFNPMDLPPPSYYDSVFGPQAVNLSIDYSGTASNGAEFPARPKGEQETTYTPVYSYYNWSNVTMPPTTNVSEQPSAPQA